MTAIDHVPDNGVKYSEMGYNLITEQYLVDEHATTVRNKTQQKNENRLQCTDRAHQGCGRVAQHPLSQRLSKC
jgi:hypothetical protein